MQRNRWFFLVLAFAGVLIPGLGVAETAPPSPRVKTAEGMVEGTWEGNFAVFKGLPYATPPVDALRWRAPQPAKPWQGVREADAFGKACMQAPGAALATGAGDIGPMSEDCLTLNIWVPNGTAQPGSR